MEIRCGGSSVVRRCLLVPLLLAAGCSGPVHELSEPAPVAIEGDWRYRWGDSPRDVQGVPEWTLESFSASGWQVLEGRGAPPGRGEHEHLWLRTRLPEWGGRDPSLFIHSVDLLFEAYLDDRMIYRFGEFDESGRGPFAGWPWHTIKLPPGFQGQTLSLRIFSDVSDIGVVGTVMLAPREHHVRRIVRGDLARLVLCVLFAFIGVLCVVMLVRETDRRTLGAFALIALQVAVWTLGQTEIKQILLDEPLFWIYADLGSLYFLPATLCFFVEETYGTRFRRLLRIVRYLCMAYAAGALGLAAAGLISLPFTIKPFDALALAAVAVVLLTTAEAALRRDPEARIFTGALFLFVPFAVYDIMAGWEVWVPGQSHWGMLVFMLMLGLIVRRRFAQIHTRSILDGLTGVANRYRFEVLFEVEWRRARRDVAPLGLLMCDIDYFKGYNDTYGHARGDECLKQVAAMLSAQVRRAGDTVVRYGGEEFAVLMPGTTLEGARAVGEKLRDAVEGLKIDHNFSDVSDHVTISIGAASLVPDAMTAPVRLVEQADQALYRAKREGRNRLCLAGGGSG